MFSNWSVEFSTGPVNSHAWGASIGEEFAAKDARLCLISHEEGSVYLTLVTKGSDETFLLNFGQYWGTSTYKRWGISLITYRSGPSGLFLDFPGSLVLQDFEDCCDRLLPRYSGGGPAPTLKVLRDLGIVSLPRLVGGFLTQAPGRVQVAHLGESESASTSDEETETASSVYSADHVDEEILNVIANELGGLRTLA